MNLGLIQNGMMMGLLALAIPFIIHLLFRTKPKEVNIGSIRFLKEIMEQHRNRRRVMRWFLMGLRMLGVILLALLFARPYLVERSAKIANDRFVGVLIDRSASMQLMSGGTRLIETAVDEAKQLLAKAEPDSKFEIAFFDHEVTPVVTNDTQSSPRSLAESLKTPAASYAATDYAAAFRWAHDVFTSSKSSVKELHVFTDLQQSGLAWSEVEPMPADVLVKVHDIGRELPNNVAITGATPTQLVVRPGEATSINVSILNSGPFPLEETPIVLEMKNDNRTIREKQKVKLAQGSIQTVSFELPSLEQGLWRGSVGVELIDDLAFDNQRHLAVLSAPQYNVLVIDGEPNEQDEILGETYFLQSALRLAPTGASFAASPYFPNVGSSGRPLSEFDVIVMANVREVSATEANRLQAYLNQGGGLIFFGGENVTREGYTALTEAGLIPGEIVTARESYDLPWRIQSWNEKHSIFSVFNDPQNGNLRHLAFRGITELKPENQNEVIATFHDGKPFLLERKIGDEGGVVLWVATSCDNQWSTWTQSELYVPIMHQMLGHLTGLNAGGPVREQVIDTTASETLVSSSPGVFENTKSWQVINVSPRESETDRCSLDDFVGRFELNVGTTEQPTKVARAGAFGSPLDVRENEIWHWILFALVIVMIAEFFVGNRTAA